MKMRHVLTVAGGAWLYSATPALACTPNSVPTTGMPSAAQSCSMSVMNGTATCNDGITGRFDTTTCKWVWSNLPVEKKWVGPPPGLTDEDLGRAPSSGAHTETPENGLKIGTAISDGLGKIFGKRRSAPQQSSDVTRPNQDPKPNVAPPTADLRSQELDVLGLRIGDPISLASQTLESRGLYKIAGPKNSEAWSNGGKENVIVATTDTPQGRVISALTYEVITTADFGMDEVIALVRKRYGGLGATVNGGTYYVSDPRDGDTVDKNGYNRNAFFKHPFVTAFSESGRIGENERILRIKLNAGSSFLKARSDEQEQARRLRASKEKVSF